ncbi:MAG: hypothetical protein ACKON8_09425 [Planctomycetota bacterium]
MSTKAVTVAAPRFDAYRQLASRAFASLPFGVSAAAISVAVLLLI